MTTKFTPGKLYRLKKRFRRVDYTWSSQPERYSKKILVRSDSLFMFVYSEPSPDSNDNYYYFLVESGDVVGWFNDLALEVYEPVNDH